MVRPEAGLAADYDMAAPALALPVLYQLLELRSPEYELTVDKFYSPADRSLPKSPQGIDFH